MNTRTKSIVAAVCLSLQFLCTDAGAVRFTPIVKSWNSADYDANRQNWCITQAPDGVMYVANNNTMLEFDGHTFISYKLPGNTVVRSVYADPDGRIYAGSYMEFGYFERNSRGQLEYTSLSKQLPESNGRWDVWRICKNGNRVYFQTFGSLFIYDGNDVQVVERIGLLNMTEIDGTLYAQKINGDFCVLKDDNSLRPIVSRQSLHGDDVVAALPYGNHTILLLTRSHGLYICRDNALIKLSTDFEDVLDNGQFNRAITTSDGMYVIGSALSGIYAFDAGGHLIWQLDKTNGLENETVLDLSVSSDGNIWAALDDGFACILNSSGLMNYFPENPDIGMVYDFLVDGGTTYIATNRGAFISKDGKMSSIPNTDGQNWYIDRFGKDIFLGNNMSTFVSDGNAFNEKKGTNGSIVIKEIAGRDGTPMLIEGTYTHINIYKKDGDGHWTRHASFPEHPLVKSFETDANGHIWCQDVRSGFSCITLSDDAAAIREEKRYSSLSGTNNEPICIFKINGRVAFTNGQSYYIYDEMSGEILPSNNLNEALDGVSGIYQVTPAQGNSYWLVSDKKVYLLDCGETPYRITRQIPFAMLGIYGEDRASVSYDEGTSVSYLCLDGRVVRIDSRFTMGGCPKQLSCIAMETFNDAGERYNLGPEGGTAPAGFNTISITLRYPEYTDMSVQMRYRLEGLNSNPEYSDNLTHRWERLSKGDYTLYVEVIQNGEVADTLSIPFRIMPYWYETTWFLLLALLMLALFIAVLQNVVVSRIRHFRDLQRSVEAAEMEKTRIEDELKARTKELASMAAMTDLSDTDKWDMFKSNFDRVEEHFFSTLKEKYPQLTAADLKFCAMLRLNLSTKEIADALNMTTRGVESARYRLRKKFNLHTSDSLTDFILKVK